MEPTKILQADFLDILFENRNKDYGAYTLRKSYPRRLLIALPAAISLALLLLVISSLGGKKDDEPEINGKEEKIRRASNDIPLKKTPPPKPKQAAPAMAAVQRKTAQIHYTAPKLVDLKDISPPRVEDETAASSTINQGGTPPTPGTPPAPPAPPSSGPSGGEPEIPGEPDIYIKVEIEASFPGGFKQFLENNMRYPSAAQDAGQQGIVTIQFIVDTEGRVSELEVDAASPVKYPSLVQEAIRIIKKSSGKWKPGIQGGMAVKSYHSQKIYFVLPEDE